jgi:tetratricopeptide (TPR) repeat protein
VYDLRAQAEMARGRLDAAEGDWRRATQLDAGDVPSRLALARLLGAKGLWADAAALYREVLLIDPRSADAVLGLGEAYEKMGRKVGARGLMAAAAQSGTDRRVCERWARLALDAGELEEARTALERVVALSEGTAKRDAMVELVELYMRMDQPDAALRAAAEALAIEAPAGPVSLALYDAVALATDQEVLQVGERLERTLSALQARSLTREEVFAAVEAERSRLGQVQRTLTGLTPPPERRKAQAARLFGYALADEAALQALMCVDLGEADHREAFATRWDEARREIGRLKA